MVPSLPYRPGRVRVGDGLRLFYRDYAGGPGVPLLCLAGLTRHGGDFEAVAERLRAGRRVVCLDLRGRGGSEWDPSGRSYQPRAYLDDVRHLLAALGLGQVAVCGTSLGGFLAMGMGVLVPTALAGVILNDAGPDPDLQAVAGIKAYMQSLSERPPADWAAARAALAQAMPEIGLRSEAEWEAFTRGTFTEVDGRLVASWDPALNRSLDGREAVPDLWPLFRSLRDLPLLLFRGENSNLLRRETVERMRGLHPSLEAITVAGAGHTPTLREPEIQDTLDDFLDRLDRRSGRHA